MMTKGKIAYLVLDHDYDEEDMPIPDSGTWELKEYDPGYSSNVKKIVYFEVE